MPYLPPLASISLEAVLVILLAITLCYCVLLERRLSAMRKGQDALKGTIAELNKAIASAGTSIGLLRSATTTAAANLDERMGLARKLIDELSLMTASGERIAQRFDQGVERANERTVERAPVETRRRPREASLPSGSVMGRLDALKVSR